MRTWLAGLVFAAALLFAAPSAASVHYGIEVPDEIEVVYPAAEPGEPNGGFLSPGTYCSWFYCEVNTTPTIYLWHGAGVPDSIMRMILWHEIGHYDQWKRMGEAYRPWYRENPVRAEWDADVYQIRASCEAGIDPTRTIWDMWSWVFLDGYEGDDNHGTLLERIEHALLAIPTSCGGAQSE